VTRFNLSQWALGHKSFVIYLMIVSAIAGYFAYFQLGREEDPPFTIKTMVVRTLWPGATTNEMVRHVTDRIEKKLEEVPGLDYVRSYTKPGDATVFVNLKDTVRASDVPGLWYQVRKKVGDIRYSLPSDIVGPYFNDDFGDTYSTIYAFTADGFTHRELRDYLDQVRAELLRVQDVAKVDFIGTQDEKVYLEYSSQQLASLGIDPNTLIQTLQAQNAVVPSGTVEATAERIAVRVTGGFETAKSLQSINFSHNGRNFRLSDLAKIKRTYADPPQPLFRYSGEPAIGLAISMVKNGDVLALGENLAHLIREITADLPNGIDVHLVANQPHVVEEAVGEFTKSLFEAIAIVLAVSFFALGWRPGIVVAIAIPLVLAITFVIMQLLDVALQRISLGALIIALGLLVDDAMIAVEMMIKKMEEGLDKVRAAAFAYTSTAFPMLTGTLVTIAGFVPIGFAKSGAGEYTYTMFVVIAVALSVSWIVAVLFTPLTGVLVLPAAIKGHGSHGQSRFSRGFHRFLSGVLRFKYLTLAATAMLFVASLAGMRFVQQEFFPASDRAEIFVNLTLPQNASIRQTEKVVSDVEKIFKTDPDISYWSFYIGQGAVRFYLPLDQQLANDFFAQAVVVTKGYDVRPQVQARLEKALADGFDDVLARVSPLELGPPVGWPIKFRISGQDPVKTRGYAHAFAQVLGGNANVQNINYDWNEMAKMIRIDVDQDRARALGVSSQQLSTAINAMLSGTTITQLRDATYLVDIVARAVEEERAKIDTLRNMTVLSSSGGRVPIQQIANISYVLEPPLIWRRQRLPTVTVQADIGTGLEAATVIQQLAEPIAKFRSELPPGYSVDAGGVTEDSAKAQASIAAGVPLMLFLMATILMTQLMSFQRLILVFLTAPLALIGVVGAFLISGAPMGFVAILGIISLIGMVIRNSVILITQIDEHIAEGEPPWQAVITATEHRLRPILLTAAAAILGMIPIAPTVFWGPMAYAVMGGLAAATLLTLVFLPALYVAWFRIKPPVQQKNEIAAAFEPHLVSAQ
jgi:multidrug efflux pump